MSVTQTLTLTRVVPLADFVLIKRIDEAADVSAGGIAIPEIAKAKSNKGRVISVGEGRIVGNTIVPIPLSEGDIVLFSKYSPEEIKIDDEDFLLVRYDELKLRERLVIG